MRVDQRDGGLVSLPLLVMVMLMFNIHCCRAAAFMEKSNTSFRCGGGRLDDDCSLIAEDIELELLIDSYMIRMLAGKGDPVTGPSLDPHKTIPCGPGKPYGPCLPPKVSPPTQQNCGTYTRPCHG